MWNFLIDMYIRKPIKNNKERFFSVLVFFIVSLSFPLSNINILLYPAPDLNDLKKMEGVLVSVKDNTGGPRSHIKITVLDGNKKSFKLSGGVDNAALYEKNVGEPIEVWYRWSVDPISSDAKEIRVNNIKTLHYLKDNTIRSHKLVFSISFVFFAFCFSILLIPWITFLRSRYGLIRAKE